HDLDGEEVAPANMAERLAVEGEAPRRDDRMDVGVEVEVTLPGVEHQRGAEDGVEPALPEGKQRVGRRVEEGVEDRPRRELGEEAELGRKGEHDVEVPYVQLALAALGDPPLLGERLALRAMPVAARVVRGMLVAARRALVDMTPERGGAALP